MPGVWISGNERSCGGGHFAVRELLLGPEDTVLSFAVDFVLNCGSPSGPLLTGSLQYNSIVDISTMTLSVEPTLLRFGAIHDGMRITAQTSPQTVRLTLSRPGVAWTASSNAPWILITPSSGTGSAVVSVNMAVLGGSPQIHTLPMRVTIALTDVGGTSQTIDFLSLKVYAAGTTAPPLRHHRHSSAGQDRRHRIDSDDRLGARRP